MDKNRLEIFTAYYMLLFLGFIGVGIFAIGFIFCVQYMTDPLYKKDTRLEVIEPERGSILSHDGKMLATSLTKFELRWDSKAYKFDHWKEKGTEDAVFLSELSDLCIALSKTFGDKTPREYREYMLNGRYSKGNRDMPIGNRYIYYEELLELKRNAPIIRERSAVGGFIIIEVQERVRPYKDLARRIVGYVNSVGGGTGIDYTMNHNLEGIPGYRYVRSLVGKESSTGLKRDNMIDVENMPRQNAIDGMNIRTTIDLDIQEAAQHALKKKLTDDMASDRMLEGGTVIVMEVATGAIRAMVNLFRDENGNFSERYNYAISNPSEPGSTLKLASLLATLDDELVTLDTKFFAENGSWEYGKHKITDSHRYGILTLKEGFELSSNIVFGKLTSTVYNTKEKEQAYVNKLFDMKLVENLQLDIAGEAPARITTPDSRLWSQTSITSLGYGYAVDLTPMHVLRFYNAVANDGVMMRPYFIESYEKDGKVIKRTEPVVESAAICSKKAINEAKKALEGVVSQGTATNIYDKNSYKIAGKTGTARRFIEEYHSYESPAGMHKYQATFVGYFPADNPQYSCISVIYSGLVRGNLYGSTWGCPVFKDVADHIYATHPEWSGQKIASSASIDSIARRADAVRDRNQRIIHTAGKIPNVKGMTLQDAVFQLENASYTVDFEGVGKVVAQIPEAGEEADIKSVVKLKLAY